MIFPKRIYTLTAVFIFLFATTGLSQNTPIGYWESHLPYNTAIGLATNGTTLYTIGNEAMFKVNIANSDQTEPFSKVEGMSDIGMQAIGYDMATSTAVLVYGDGNIDLYKDNTFYNIPDLKMSGLAGLKTIYQAYTENGMAYLCSQSGIYVVDLSGHKIVTNLPLTARYGPVRKVASTVTSFIDYSGYFYAATNVGLYRIDNTSPQMQEITDWQRIDSTDGIADIANLNNQLYFSSASCVYKYVHDSVKKVFTGNPNIGTQIEHIDAGINSLLISQFRDSTNDGQVCILDTAANIIDSIYIAGKPLQALTTPDNTIWVADSLYGLRKRTGPNTNIFVFPAGPNSPFSFDIYANNKSFYVAHGGYNQTLFAYSSTAGFSYYNGDKWTLYQPSQYSQMNGAKDFVAITKNESDGTVYAGSFLNGLIVLKPDGSMQTVNQNSIFDGSFSYGPSSHQVIGLTIDNTNNLWVSLMSATNELYAKTPDNNWYKYSVPGLNLAGPMVVDNNGQAYFVSDLNNGIGVYNTNGTLADVSDDAAYHMQMGAGFGNLPSNQTICVAKDNNNEIWIGTDNGICIVTDCKAPFTKTAPCEAIIPFIKSGQDSGYLFSGMNVNSIAVDAANQKWIGTNFGVWLLSPDGTQVISKFTVDNSPLPSNFVEKITIDKVTGDVYIGTFLGLVCYHGAVTESGVSNQNAFVFPDPVASGYTGPIAIKGLIDGSDVRITDINGQLVYRTNVMGGQVIWDGKDYTGRRPQSGVYLIFISGKDGKQTYCGKVVFLQ